MGKEAQITDTPPENEKVQVAEALPHLLDYGYGFYRKPPYATFETHTVNPEQNGFEASAMALIHRALEEIPHVEGDDRQANYYLDLAALQVALNQDPTDIIAQSLNLASQRSTVLVARRAAAITAHAGDFSNALHLAQLASGKERRKSFPLRELATTIYELGGEYLPAFDESLEVLSDEIKRGYTRLSVTSLIATAEASKLFGIDYTSYLNQTENLLVEGGLNSAWAYRHLACAYARMGNFDRARELAGQIRHTEKHGQDATDCAKKEEKDRKAVYATIAYSQADKGEFLKAVESASECGVPLVMCNVFLQQANQLALRGENPSNAIERAILAAVKSQPREFTFFSQPLKKNNNDWIARIYAEAARIQALAGMDPDVLQYNALSSAYSIQAVDLRLEALLDIIPTLAVSGKDPNPLLNSSLSLYDSDTKVRGFRNIGDLLDFHRAALFSGTTDFIDPIGERLTQSEREASNQDRNWARNSRPEYTIQAAFAFTRWAATT